MKTLLLSLTLLISVQSYASDCSNMEGLYTCDANQIVLMEKINTSEESDVQVYRITERTTSGIVKPTIFILDNIIREGSTEKAKCVDTKTIEVTDHRLNTEGRRPYTRTYKVNNSALEVTQVTTHYTDKDLVHVDVKNCQKL